MFWYGTVYLRPIYDTLIWEVWSYIGATQARKRARLPATEYFNISQYILHEPGNVPEIERQTNC